MLCNVRTLWKQRHHGRERLYYNKWITTRYLDEIKCLMNSHVHTTGSMDAGHKTQYLGHDWCDCAKQQHQGLPQLCVIVQCMLRGPHDTRRCNIPLWLWTCQLPRTRRTRGTSELKTLAKVDHNYYVFNASSIIRTISPLERDMDIRTWLWVKKVMFWLATYTSPPSNTLQYLFTYRT